MNVDQQTEQDAFEQGFAQASGQPIPAAPAAEVVTEQPTEVDTPAPAADAQPQAATAPEADPAPAGEVAADAGEDDPVVLDGFKRSEVKRLLAEATKVSALEQQLRKAQGKIGELNSRLQSAPAPAPAATPTPQAPELPAQHKQFEQDFPEIAAYAQALIRSQQPVQQAAPPAQVQQTVATDAAPVKAEPDPLDIELLVMDRMHSGWREKVGGQEFQLWLGAQGSEVQTAYHEAQTADALAGVIGQFDQWSVAKSQHEQRLAKGKQRLQAAVTPQGNAPQPQGALTEEQAMELEFNNIMSQR